MVESVFKKSHIDNTRPHIQETVDKLLDLVVEQGGAEPFDIVEKFALPVPSYVSQFLTIAPKSPTDIY
jgi:nitric oxide reductase